MRVDGGYKVATTCLTQVQFPLESLLGMMVGLLLQSFSCSVTNMLLAGALCGLWGSGVRPVVASIDDLGKRRSRMPTSVRKEDLFGGEHT